MNANNQAMKKIFLILFAGCLLSNSAYAQDPEFSQSYAIPLYLNPAFTGTGTAQRVGMNFRDQWPNIPGTFTDYSVSYDRNIIDSADGIGILANRDIAGQAALTTTNISLLYAHQFHVKSFTLSIGVQGTFHQKTVDWSKLTFGSMIDPTRGFVYNTNEAPPRTSIAVPDFSAGLLGYGKHYFVGFAMDHLTQPDESFVTGSSPLPLKYTVNAGGMIEVGNFVLSPTILYVRQQDMVLKEFDGYIITKHITGGIGYRYNDAMIFRLGYSSKLFRIGYSYDYTVSALTNNTGGTHEASLAILLHYKSAKLKKVSGINIPAF